MRVGKVIKTELDSRTGESSGNKKKINDEKVLWRLCPSPILALNIKIS